jgi:hypothetical protein
MEIDDELREAYVALFRAIEAGDGDRVSAMIADEPGFLFIGTDPDEWWRSPQDVGRTVVTQKKAAPDMTFRSGTITAYREGEIGLVADNPAFVTGDGTEQPFRVTCAFRRDAEGWKLVQAHTSIAVPNAEVAGFEALG